RGAGGYALLRSKLHPDSAPTPVTHAKARAAAREKRLISILMRIPLNSLQAHGAAAVPDGTAGQR
ncbi:MAG: hypothetical protein RL260_3176, partial [Pseudomonadota bacterium]